MVEPGSAIVDASLRDRIEQLTRAFVAVPSHTGTPLENSVQGFFREWFASVDYFARHPGHCGFHPIPEDPLGRSVSWALLRGSGLASGTGQERRTIVLIHHCDTADIEDFGSLQALAYDPEALTTSLAALQASRERDFPPDVASDIAGGDWLFGRGVCDMKGGGAIEMALLERYARDEAFAGNLLLLSLPDEENLSAGMRSATLLMQDLRSRFGLDYQLMINTEPHTRLEPRTGVLYEGSLGKLMPLVYVKGQAAHVSQIFNGFNPLLLLAEIVGRTDLNPDFLETCGTESTLPPVWLCMKDHKHHYDVSLPLSAAGYLSILSLEKSPEQHLDLLHRICEEAFAAVIARMNHSHEVYSRKLGVDPSPLPWKPDVRSFQEVHRAAVEHSGAAYAAASQEKMQGLKELLASGGIGIPEAGCAMIELALDYSGITTPVVVLALSPPYYPSVSNRQMRARMAAEPRSPFLELAGLSEALRSFALDTWGQDYTCVDFYTGLSDLSYAIYTFDPSVMAFTKDAMPLWGEIYSIPFEVIKELSVPVINIGPWGKDFHKNTERVYLPDLGERTPALIQEAIRFVFDR